MTAKKVEHYYPTQQGVYTSKNQWLTCTKKPNYIKLNKPFLQIGREDWTIAARELSGTAFKLYCYLMDNQNDYKWALSSVAVEKSIGLSERSYHRAKNELLDKGYMVECENDNIKDWKYAYCLSRPGLDAKWCDKTWEDNFELEQIDNDNTFQPRDW